MIRTYILKAPLSNDSTARRALEWLQNNMALPYPDRVVQSMTVSDEPEIEIRTVGQQFGKHIGSQRKLELIADDAIEKLWSVANLIVQNAVSIEPPSEYIKEIFRTGKGLKNTMNTYLLNVHMTLSGSHDRDLLDKLFILLRGGHTPIESITTTDDQMTMTTKVKMVADVSVETIPLVRDLLIRTADINSLPSNSSILPEIVSKGVTNKLGGIIRLSKISTNTATKELEKVSKTAGEIIIESMADKILKGGFLPMKNMFGQNLPRGAKDPYDVNRLGIHTELDLPIRVNTPVSFDDTASPGDESISSRIVRPRECFKSLTRSLNMLGYSVSPDEITQIFDRGEVSFVIDGRQQGEHVSLISDISEALDLLVEKRKRGKDSRDAIKLASMAANSMAPARKKKTIQEVLDDANRGLDETDGKPTDSKPEAKG